MCNPPKNIAIAEAMEEYCSRFPHRVVLKRKPTPMGAKIECLADSTGYLYSALPATGDPLRYDESRGRIFAVLYAVLSGEYLTPQGKSYLGENRTVVLYPISNIAFQYQTSCFHNIRVFRCSRTAIMPRLKALPILLKSGSCGWACACQKVKATCRGI